VFQNLSLFEGLSPPKPLPGDGTALRTLWHRTSATTNHDRTWALWVSLSVA